ncbi:CatB-related O-acetyltransferase [Lewinella sp. 4G2]|uniref:CatB-related O-acetyltransferase n=1 Tax=Lewinella sp. 4G2 TaxID=1803372 RepID=UPI0007B463B2|nr:CatB-related O-acetyltransferase [Lewinella sp. 4G2]OAV42741.1 chloramphenicol acetyltransferase [Lewinella sp. 4G2]
MPAPDPQLTYPLPGHEKLVFLKNIIKNPNIIVGDYTYYDDFEDPENFERNVRYHFDFIGDQLIIGKFCMIASGVSFIMNGGNHLTEAVSAYPFAIFGGDWGEAMDGKTYPNKGNTVVGNDVWLGHGATIMPGVTIGDGAIIATNAMVVKDVPPYTIVGGNPARVIQKRFSDTIIEKLLAARWWDLPVEEISARVSELTTPPVE